MDRLILWIAQGCGTGRIPVAPGTFGSLAGLLWVAALLACGSVWAYAAGTVLGIVCSVWLCGTAEKILGKTDPGSVVLDEIVAMPLCFAGWLVFVERPIGTWPGPEVLFARGNWLWTIGIFIAFRVFDVVKPSPVRQSQRLPGGWGVTIDDVLAALYVNVVVVVAARALKFFHPS